MANLASTKRCLYAAMTGLATAGFIQTGLANGTNGEHGHHMWGGGWSMMFMGPFMMIVFLAAIIVIAVLAARWLLPKSETGSAAASNARGILDERFARGEIDAEEYRARCAELEK